MKLLFAHEIATDILEYTQLLNSNSPFLENLVSMCVCVCVFLLCCSLEHRSVNPLLAGIY
jgi:hypothetical protein